MDFQGTMMYNEKPITFMLHYQKDRLCLPRVGAGGTV